MTNSNDTIGSIPKGGGLKNWKKHLNRRNASVLMLLLLAFVIGSHFWLTRLPSLNAPVDTLVQFEASSRFASLSLQQRQAYYDALHKFSRQDRGAATDRLSQAEKQQYRINTDPFNPRAKERDEFTKAFNADHTAAGRRALLAKMMDEHEREEKGGDNHDRAGGRSDNEPGDTFTPEREMHQSMAEIRMEDGLPPH